MGDPTSHSDYTPEDFNTFAARLAEETKILCEWFEKGVFSKKGKQVGAELEAWLVDPNYQPLPGNEELLQCLHNPFIVSELSQFNLELNITPEPIQGKTLMFIQEDLEQYWANCNACASKQNGKVIMIGILPTVQENHLTLKHMSNRSRYVALNNQVVAARKGKPVMLDIQGAEILKTSSDHVMLESAATSLQVHMEVSQEEAPRFYNACLIASAPIVAAGANSPYLFGKDLWDETRIALFEQAIALGGEQHDRVHFGSGYVKETLLECFLENQKDYAIFLPELMERDPRALAHLKLHNGTIWRWNRPLVGFDRNGQPHIRIEHRVLAAGPTILDVVANIAFFLGLTQMLATQKSPPEQSLSFDTAKENFYRAAQKGIEAKIEWLDGKTYVIQGLILDQLIPLAKKGLRKLRIDKEDIAYYIDDIFANRIAKRKTGAIWQRRFIQTHGRNFHALMKFYGKNQDSGLAVHEWEI